MSQGQTVGTLDKVIVWVLLVSAVTLIGLIPYFFQCVVATRVEAGEWPHYASPAIALPWVLVMIACAAFGVVRSYRVYGPRFTRNAFRVVVGALFLLSMVAKAGLHVCVG